MTRLLLLACLSLLFTGCATLINGSRQAIAFKSTPEGATVRSDGEVVCTTPCSAELTRADEHVITLEKPGHYPYRMTMRVRGSNLIALYTLFPSPLIFVDLATGGAWFLTPEDGIDRKLDALVGADAQAAPVAATTAESEALPLAELHSR